MLNIKNSEITKKLIEMKYIRKYNQVVIKYNLIIVRLCLHCQKLSSTSRHVLKMTGAVSDNVSKPFVFEKFTQDSVTLLTFL